ncbi:hypothetical protein IAU60_000656 [Kwoniella sp. DSM 27419]
MSTDEPATTSPSDKSSTWRRLSHPPLPSFRNIPSLRAALLGYLGEVELAIRNRLDLAPEEEERLRGPSSSPEVSEWSTSLDGTTTDNDLGSEGVMSQGYTSSRVGGPSSEGLRNRLDGQFGASSSAGRVIGDDDMAGDSQHIKILNHLTALREEALNYLPSLPAVPSVSIPHRMPPMPIPSRDWLRSLPSRLSMVDSSLSMGALYDQGRGKLPEGMTGLVDSGAIEGARKRVLELVHTVLPSEDWAGWERLGWEEQEEDVAFHHGQMRRVRSASLNRSRAERLDDEEDEEEPEYLFPNRTPASAKAMARRRAVRSKSLGASSFPTIGSLRVRPGKLERVKSAPYQATRYNAVSDEVSDDDEAEGEEPEQVDKEDDQDYIATHPEISDTKLTALAARKNDREMGPTVQEALRRSADGTRLITYEDLPAVWRNNEHLHTGYCSRFIPLHLKTGPVPLIKSAFRMHNETLNIHSHFIPTILILLCIPFIIYQSPLPHARPLDTAAMVAYLLAATSCLFSSASWHVLSGCASKRWFEWGACVDYIGISWLIAASFGTVVYNGFYCQPKLVLLYCSVNACCGALGSYLPFQRWFNERKNKHLRISFFLFLCFAMFAPMLQLFYQHGVTKARAFVAPFGWSIIAYLTGLVFYAFHFPECAWPGKFDRYGMSHQWWHMGIVLAIWLHYRALFIAHDKKAELSCAMPGADRSVAAVLEGWLGLATV